LNQTLFLNDRLDSVQKGANGDIISHELPVLGLDYEEKTRD
jgi:hypothetical protein